MRTLVSSRFKQAFLFIMFIACFLAAFAAEKTNLERVVAIVEGEEITYGQIAIDVEKFILSYKLQNGKEPDKNELPMLITKSERAQLIGEIHTIIRNKKIEEFAINVSEKETQQRLKSLYSKIEPKDVIDKENKYLLSLAQALREVQKNPAKEKEIYKKNLKDLMTYEEWTGHRLYYDTPTKIGWIEKSLPIKEEDLYKPNPAIIAWMLNEKLMEYVTKDVSVQEAEIYKLYQKEYGDLRRKPVFDEVKEDLKARLLNIKKHEREMEWWQEQYKKAKIEIKDERFKDVLETLIAPDVALYGPKLKPSENIIADVNIEDLATFLIDEGANLEKMGIRLAGMIIQKIAILEARSKGMTVSEEEIKDFFNQHYAPDRDKEIMKATKEYIVELQSTVEALESWRNKPENDAKIFKELQKKFPKRVTRADWQAIKDKYGKTDAAFAKYKQSVDKIISNLQSKKKLYETHSSNIRDTLLYQKFLKSLPTEVAREDKEDFLKFLARKKIDQGKFDNIGEEKKKELKQKYNFFKCIRAAWGKYEVLILDKNTMRKTYEFLGFSPKE